MFWGSPIKRSGRVPARTPDRHLPQRTVSTIRGVVTITIIAKNYMPRRFP